MFKPNLEEQRKEVSIYKISNQLPLMIHQSFANCRISKISNFPNMWFGNFYKADLLKMKSSILKKYLERDRNIMVLIEKGMQALEFKKFFPQLSKFTVRLDITYKGLDFNKILHFVTRLSSTRLIKIKVEQDSQWNVFMNNFQFFHKFQKLEVYWNYKHSNDKTPLRISTNKITMYKNRLRKNSQNILHLFFTNEVPDISILYSLKINALVVIQKYLRSNSKVNLSGLSRLRFEVPLEIFFLKNNLSGSKLIVLEILIFKNTDLATQTPSVSNLEKYLNQNKFVSTNFLHIIIEEGNGVPPRLNPYIFYYLSLIKCTKTFKVSYSDYCHPTSKTSEYDPVQLLENFTSMCSLLSISKGKPADTYSHIKDFCYLPLHLDFFDVFTGFLAFQKTHKYHPLVDKYFTVDQFYLCLCLASKNNFFASQNFIRDIELDGASLTVASILIFFLKEKKNLSSLKWNSDKINLNFPYLNVLSEIMENSNYMIQEIPNIEINVVVPYTNRINYEDIIQYLKVVVMTRNFVFQGKMEIHVESLNNFDKKTKEIICKENNIQIFGDSNYSLGRNPKITKFKKKIFEMNEYLLKPEVFNYTLNHFLENSTDLKLSGTNKFQMEPVVDLIKDILSSIK